MFSVLEHSNNIFDQEENQNKPINLIKKKENQAVNASTLADKQVKKDLEDLEKIIFDGGV